MNESAYNFCVLIKVARSTDFDILSRNIEVIKEKQVERKSKSLESKHN